MSEPRPHDAAFRLLRRDLLRRRLESFDLRLRGEIVLLAVVIGGFVFWQARVPLDGLRRSAGALAVVGALGGLLLVLALVSAVVVFVRHRRQLRHALPGPAWLALPVPPIRIVDHVAWEARGSAVWGAALAPGVLAAAFGLVPAWALVAIAGAFAALVVASSYGATALAARIALHAPRPMRRTSEPLLDLLVAAQRESVRARMRPAHWWRSPAWLVLWRKDLQNAVRPTAARGRLAAPLALALGAGSVWLLPIEPALARLLSFAAALCAAATLAELLIALAGEDPLGVLRTLPIGARSVWVSRMVWGALLALGLAALQSLLARPLAPHALGVLLVWQTCATIAIALLGVHYGMTLGASPAAAQRLLTLTLAIAIAASLMIPLLGWLVLLTAVIHSARRVPRWATLEVER